MLLLCRYVSNTCAKELVYPKKIESFACLTMTKYAKG